MAGRHCTCRFVSSTLLQQTYQPGISSPRTLNLAYYSPENDTLYANFQKVVMSEVSFAKSFLTNLDKKAIKLPADHVSDARKYPVQSPYILPRQTHPFPRKTASTSGQQAKQKTVTATLKPMRGGETITVGDLTLTSTIHDVKTSYAQQSGQQQDKIKLLLNKKPAADLKTLSELGVEGESVEFSVMLMGGGASAATTPAVEKSEPVMSPPVSAPPADKMDIDSTGPAPESEKAQAQAESRPEAKQDGVESILKGEEFWADLKGFLAQRLRDEGEGEKLVKVFREAYGRR